MRALVILDTTVPDTGLAFLLVPQYPQMGWTPIWGRPPDGCSLLSPNPNLKVMVKKFGIKKKNHTLKDYLIPEALMSSLTVEVLLLQEAFLTSSGCLPPYMPALFIPLLAHTGAVPWA